MPNFRFPARGAMLLFCLVNCGLAVAAELTGLVLDDSGNPVEDAVVLATPKGAGPARKPARGTVQQIDKEFVPYVTPVLVGSALSFPNKDNVRHHVYSLSPAKKFELPLYAGTPSEAVVFDKPGVVTLGCNIHDWMIAHVYVSETPYFGKTGADGKATLGDLPPGDYAVRVWHPRMEATEQSTIQQIAVARTGVTEASWRLKLKSAGARRRAPVPGNRGYR